MGVPTESKKFSFLYQHSGADSYLDESQMLPVPEDATDVLDADLTFEENGIVDHETIYVCCIPHLQRDWDRESDGD